MLSSEQVQQVADSIGDQTLTEALISGIRCEFPGIHFTYCMDDDIPEREPILSHSAFNLYLIDGREHCLCFTNNLEHATGIVIAELIPD
ncbi:MAG: hypothetical protein IPN42_06150 [Methylococcaceae bacterium]|nr:hypothetical protein [Methylococcaceae bacterium]